MKLRAFWAALPLLLAALPAFAANTAGNNADGQPQLVTGLAQDQAYPYLFNGTTFDRWRGDLTNGAWVNVKNSALPTGAALDATLQTINGHLSSLSYTGANLNVVEVPSGASLIGVVPVSSTALEANHVIKASAGNLYSFEVSADVTLSASAWWLMFYDATSAPADGAVTPLKCYALPSGATSYAAAFPHPVRFNTGIVMGVSTTGCFTKTASTHAQLSGDAQ